MSFEKKQPNEAEAQKFLEVIASIAFKNDIGPEDIEGLQDLKICSTSSAYLRMRYSSEAGRFRQRVDHLSRKLINYIANSSSPDERYKVVEIIDDIILVLNIIPDSDHFNKIDRMNSYIEMLDCEYFLRFDLGQTDIDKCYQFTVEAVSEIPISDTESIKLKGVSRDKGSLKVTLMSVDAPENTHPSTRLLSAHQPKVTFNVISKSPMLPEHDVHINRGSKLIYMGPVAKLL